MNKSHNGVFFVMGFLGNTLNILYELIHLLFLHVILHVIRFTTLNGLR